jgi:hypothetical protein
MPRAARRLGNSPSGCKGPLILLHDIPPCGGSATPSERRRKSRRVCAKVQRELVRRDARDHDERCECDQDVDEAAQDDAAYRVPCLVLSRGMDARGRDSQSIVAVTAVDLEQAAGSFGAAAAQLSEHELGTESGVPDEPVSLGPFASTSAQVAGVAGNGSDRIARAQTSQQPCGSGGNSKAKRFSDPELAFSCIGETGGGLDAHASNQRPWRGDAPSACSSLARPRA